MARWSVPRCFEGGTVAVLASGPSMSQAVANAVHAAGIPAIAVNTTFRLAPWAWMLYAADTPWWMHKDHADAQAFAGLKVSIEQVANDKNPPPGVAQLRNAGRMGYSDDPAVLHTLGNGGAQALQIAIKAGAACVLLCGFDMAGEHWHGPHPEGLKGNTRGSFERWVAMFNEAAPLLKRRADIVNCTPESGLKCFRTADLKAELAARAQPAAPFAALQA